MNQATPPQAAPEATSATPAPMSYEERAAAIFGSDADVAQARTEAEGLQQLENGRQVPQSAPEPDDQAKARAARRAALDAMKARERETVDAKTALKERDELRRRLATIEEQSKAYSSYIDPSKLTKEQFFALAEKNPELTPKELGEWLRERMANPEAAAARSAKAAVDPEIAALREKLSAQEKALEDFKAQQAQTQAQAEEQHYVHQLHAFIQENAQHAPLTARFVAAKGIQGLYDAALSVAQRLPEGAGPQAVLDELEESLIAGQRDYAAIYGNPATTHQRQQAISPPQNQAAAKAPMHVSNTLAQQRSSVVDEQTDFAKLPLTERANRLFGT